MRVGTTLYKVVNQPCANGGYEKKRVVWNNSTLRQDYGKNYQKFIVILWNGILMNKLQCICLEYKNAFKN